MNEYSHKLISVLVYSSVSSQITVVNTRTRSKKYSYPIDLILSNKYTRTSILVFVLVIDMFAAPTGAAVAVLCVRGL